MSNDPGSSEESASHREARKAAEKALRNWATEQVAALAPKKATKGEGFVQHLYNDYETYRKIQEVGNKGKLHAQFVKKGHIFFLAKWMTEAQVGAKREPITFGLCHGVRRGREQAWFREKLAGANVIGTEISETANDFDNTVQWDFHDDNAEWQDRADFVYSNSWDHAYDPGKAFRAWAKCLKPGGWILIDHTRSHLPRSTNMLDPFGATLEVAIRILGESCADLGRVVELLDRTGEKEYRCTVIVFQRA